MLANIYWIGRIFSILLLVEICLNLFTLPSPKTKGTQRVFSLADSYTSTSTTTDNNNNKKAPLFVQQLDQTQANHQALSLLYAPSISQDQDLDAGNLAPLFEGPSAGTKNHDANNNNNGFDETEYLGSKVGYAYDEQVDRGDPIEQHHHHQNQLNSQDGDGVSPSIFDDGTTISKDDNESTLNSYNNYFNGNHMMPESSADNADTNATAAPKTEFLTKQFIERTCNVERGSRRQHFKGSFLTYCSRYEVSNLISNDIHDYLLHHESDICKQILDEFIQLDETINQFDNLFIKLLSRYNCHNGYSVKWNCDDCKRAYKDWLCATHLPFYMAGGRVKPCISFCERVEQRCPYLHPITREQYGGQPVFICRDPNIPFVPEITPDIPYSEPGDCYDLCHLQNNRSELVSDSLSKYNAEKCPYPTRADVKTGGSKNPDGSLKPYNKRDHVHGKRLEELREVLANYQNQAKTHRYHADHSSIEHPKSANEISHHSS